MSAYLASSPQVLALLQDAKERPEDDAPRLVLADWLEDRGDAERAEFIRIQCQVAQGISLPASQRQAMSDRARQLFHCHGGAWLGSLWRWWLGTVSWHRGLLAVKLPRRVEADEVLDVLPWLDTVLFDVTGKRAFQRAARLLDLAGVNHLHLAFRPQLGEETVLEVLSQVPSAPACGP